MVELVLVSIGGLVRFGVAVLVISFIVAAIVIGGSRSSSEAVSGGPAAPAISTCGPTTEAPPVV